MDPGPKVIESWLLGPLFVLTKTHFLVKMQASNEQ